MNYDEFSFFNQQLANMLRDGLPLEGGLRQLCAAMSGSRLKDELRRLETDLSQGKQLPEALAARDLPDFYKQMVTVGVRANNLPGMLSLLADYYRRLNQIRDRLTGLMVYPLIVLGTSFILSVAIAWMAGALSRATAGELVSLFGRQYTLNIAPVLLPPVFLGGLLGLAILCLAIPSWWRHLRWRLPGFREAALAQFASAMALMLEYGGNLKEAINLMRNLEKDSPVEKELSNWADNLAKGAGKAPEFAANSRLIPPLFVWLLASAGEDLAGGFRQAAQIYQDRAARRIEMLLYAALPVSVLFLGAMIVSQMLPVTRVIVVMLDMLGRVD